MDNLPEYQTIEKAFQVPAEVIATLPETTESRRAVYHLGEAERYTYEARERAKTYDDEPSDVTTPGPAMLGWPWRSC